MAERDLPCSGILQKNKKAFLRNNMSENLKKYVKSGRNGLTHGAECNII